MEAENIVNMHQSTVQNPDIDRWWLAAVSDVPYVVFYPLAVALVDVQVHSDERWIHVKLIPILVLKKAVSA